MAYARPLSGSDSEYAPRRKASPDYSADEEDDDSHPSTNGGNVLQFVGNRTSDSDMITVKIDLTDPDDLARKLELIDLTDEESEMLLEKATELNTWLRQELQRQSERGGGNVAPAGDQQYSSMYFVSAPAAGVSSDTEDGRYRRPRTYSGGATVLPPLPRQGGARLTATYATQTRTSPSLSYLQQQQERPVLRSVRVYPLSRITIYSRV